tara:strand:+ start:1299 stop:1580 length:282 start_codon:yes stop_codon:yes gene_type:complete
MSTQLETVTPLRLLVTAMLAPPLQSGRMPVPALAPASFLMLPQGFTCLQLELKNSRAAFSLGTTTQGCAGLKTRIIERTSHRTTELLSTMAIP